MKRIKQLYVEFYKPKNIVKFRNTKISIERKAVARYYNRKDGY